MAYFYLLANTSRTQMFGCVIKTEHKTVVIDGGTYKDRGQLADFLRRESGAHVDAWFFTHPHHDHIGCFVDLCKNEPDITVDRLYYCFPDLQNERYAVCARSAFEAELWRDVAEWESRYPTHRVEVGERFCFDDVSVRVLRVFDPAIDQNHINNSSTVYRIDGAQASVLILGDLGIQGGEDVMRRCALADLQTDYTQMAHHGQNGVNREFYDYIKPKRCIWASPEWLWNNDRGGGFDTDIFQTVRTREWMAALGVTEHFVEKDGIQKIEF